MKTQLEDVDRAVQIERGRNLLHVCKNEEFRIKNEEFRIKNKELCIQTDGFCRWRLGR